MAATPGPQQGALVPLGGGTPSSQPTMPLGSGLDATGGSAGASTGALPARPNLPEDPVIPHNGFATHEEGERAFFHLLRKAGVDQNWTWDQTMRTIITDPLFKALNTLAEKKAAWQKVCCLD
jgi:pre-mRNA-processing factor 40